MLSSRFIDIFNMRVHGRVFLYSCTMTLSVSSCSLKFMHVKAQCLQVAHSRIHTCISRKVIQNKGNEQTSSRHTFVLTFSFCAHAVLDATIRLIQIRFPTYISCYILVLLRSNDHQSYRWKFPKTLYCLNTTKLYDKHSCSCFT